MALATTRLTHSGVAADTLVCLADGRRVPIAGLTRADQQITAVSDGRLVTAEGRAVAVGTGPIFNVRLASGRDVKATGSHDLLTGSGPQPVAALKPGNRVARARRLPEPSEPLREDIPDDHALPDIMALGWRRLSNFDCRQ